MIAKADGLYWCAISPLGIIRANTICREKARAESVLVRDQLTQWRYDKKKNPKAPKPTMTNLADRGWFICAIRVSVEFVP